MKSRVRLTNDEAIFLGLELKPNETGRNQARYYLDDTQLKNLEYYRLQPKERRFVETSLKNL